MSFEPVWGAPIIWYLFLAGLGAGAFATSAFLSWRHPDATSMRRTGYLIAPIAVGIGLVLLMLDAEAGLHDPLRFALLLSNPLSVMTWGVVFLSLFMLAALAALVLTLAGRRVPKWVNVAGLALAVCVAMYTGALLGVCRPYSLWNSALLPILFLVSAFSSGAASVLLASVGFHAEEFKPRGRAQEVPFLSADCRVAASSIAPVRDRLRVRRRVADGDVPRCGRIRAGVLARACRVRPRAAHGFGDVASVRQPQGV